ncbi:MAG: thiamine diphosphokinase, partial [Chloroflexota bacterium]
VVGDFDSLAPSLRATIEAAGCEFRTSPRAKDQTDLELALLLAGERGATSIEVLGALGGERLDHALANVFALALPESTGLPVTLTDRRHEVCLLRGPGRGALVGRPGEIVTLIPLTVEATGIDTTGLLYPLQHETLHLGRSRGVSNEFTGEEASVQLTEGLLLVVVHRGT